MRRHLGWLVLLGLGGLLLAWQAPAQAQPLCPPGTEWHPGLRRCVAPPPPCPPGSAWSHRMQRCVSKGCPPGMVWVPGHGCRPVSAPPPPGYPPPPPPPHFGAMPPPPQPPQRWAPPPGLPVPGAMMVVRASALNLRDCPGKRCGVITTLAPGESVALLEYRAGFARVRVPGRGLEGWVDYRYLALP